jgi:prefoldin subunit 5
MSTRRQHLLNRLRRRRQGDATEQERSLQARVAALEAAVEESRQLHQRLADVVDVVTEVLVPVADRDDARLRAALADLDASLDLADPPADDAVDPPADDDADDDAEDTD